MRKSFAFENQYEHFHRPAREPLRNVQELADEFGVSMPTLRALLAKQDGPAPEIHMKKASGSRVWYSPSKVRAWWKARAA